MNKYKRLVSFILCVTALITYSGSVFTYAAQLYTYGDFTYTLASDEATVVDCADSEGRIIVPSRFDANTVVAIDSFAFCNKSFSGVTLAKTIKSIGNGAFMGCTAIDEITLPEGLLYVGDNAFYGCSELESITIDDSVEYIGIDAFEECGGDLVIYGYTGSFAEEYAIEYGYSFESLGEGESQAVASGICGDDIVWEISPLGVLTVSGSGEMSAASDNSYWSEHKSLIKSIVVEEGITGIMNYAFMSCTEAEIISLPSTVERIGSYAFSGCNKLKSVEIPEGVTEIGSYAFYNCTSLSKVNFPDTVKRIGNSAFERCSSLKAAVLPEGLKNVENQTFFWCESLGRVVLPNSLKTIGVYAFSCCFALSEISLNEKLTTINESAFSRCSFTEISFPPSVSTIAEGAFGGIEPAPVLIGYDGSGAESYAKEYGFTFESLGEMPVSVIDGGEFGENLSWEIDTLGQLVISGVGASDDFYSSEPAPWMSYTVKSIELEDGITYIGKNMFNGLSNITEAVIPASVTEIAAAAFGGCESLGTVTVPEGVTKIGSSAFAGCSSLNEITIPSTAVYVAYESYTAKDAFSGCGEGFTVKGYDNTCAEFYAQKEGYSFESLGEAESKVVIEAEYTDESMADTLSYTITNDGIMTFDAGSACTIPSDSYDTPWYNYYGARELIFKDNIRGIANYAFENQKNLEKVSFPETILEIGSYAFGNRTLSFEVYGYDNTEAQTFAMNNNLTYNSLGAAMVEIIIASGTAGDNCTWELNNLGVLTIKGTGNMYDYNRPWDDYREKTKEIVIEKGINSIGAGAFEYAYSAEKITIPYTVIGMGSYCIYYGMTLYGYDGTAAQDYAENYGMSFVSLGTPPQDEVVARGSCGEEAFWSLKSDGLFTVYGSGTVDNMAWYEFKNLIKKVVIEEGITYLGIYYAFDGCEKLTEAVIADTVTYMDNYTFSGCPKLKRVKLSKAAQIPYEAFSYCYALEEVIIPSGVTTIGALSFYDCTALKEITIPASVTDIVSSAFTYCSPELVISGYAGTYVETYTRQHNITFNSLGMPPLDAEKSGTAGVLSWKLTMDGTMTVSGNGTIPDYTRYNTPPWNNYRSYISRLVIEEGVTDIGAYSFRQCEYLKEIELPSTLMTIGDYAFNLSAMPEKLELPYGLEYIGYSAFYQSVGLEEVVIPETVKEITYSFSGLEKTLTISGMTGSKAEKYAKTQGFSFNSTGVMERKIIASGDCGRYITYEFDNYGRLTLDGHGVMYDYEEGTTPWNTWEIEALEMSDDIIYIGTWAFAGATEMLSVHISEGTLEVGEYAFYGCYQMPLTTLPDGLEIIGDFAFSNCPNGIIVGKNIVGIGKGAFMYMPVYIEKGGYVEEYCRANGDEMGIRWFYKTASGKAGADISFTVDAVSGTLTFTGSGAMNDYIDYEYYNMSTALWTEYMSAVKKISISEGITYLGAGTMQRIMHPETVELPSTLTAIGAYAFMDARIKNIKIPDGCKVIAEGAFTGCMELERLVAPSGIEGIGDEAFLGCDELTVYAPADSFIYDYAIGNGIPVVATGVTAEIESAYAYINGGSCNVVIEGKALDYNKIFCVSYDEEGAYLEMAEYGKQLSSDKVKSVRCFMWEDMDSMIPLCKPADARIIDSSSGSSTGGSGAVGGSGGSTGSGGTSTGGAVGEVTPEVSVEAAMEV